MNRRSWMRRWVSLLAIAGLMLLVNQGRGAAQEAPAPDLPYQSDAPSGNRSFLLYGGAYQQVDAGQGVCVGQCAVANALTGDCTCPGGTPRSCRHASCTMRREARAGPSCTCVPNNRTRGGGATMASTVSQRGVGGGGRG